LTPTDRYTDRADHRWQRRWRELAIDSGVSLATVCLFCLLCEFVVFRLVLLASDAPANAFFDGLVRYAPNQQGVWRVRDEIAAPYAINAQGWNSGVGDYRLDRTPGTARIAIVGDSYVEALQVPFNRSTGENLAEILRTPAQAVEVFRFGISGAPMSQYLAMVEREVVRYRPDWVIVQIVHNDFDESYKFARGRYMSSFLKLRVEGGRVVGEIPPQPWAAGWNEWLRHTATARFFLYRWQVRPEFLISRLLPPAEAATYAGNTHVGRALADSAAIEAVTDYVFGRLDAIARSAGARLLIAMDGDRAAIYANQESPALVLNALASRVAEAHRIPFVDLNAAFAADWQAEHRRFEFESDGHWNEHGHKVVAKAIAAGMRDAGWPSR
jgi:lysophospholipase L1-like esterase